MDESIRTTYENFIRSRKTGTFFQSFSFGELQEKIPYRGKSWAFLAEGKNGAEGGCLAIKMKLPLGRCWLWVPYGPLILNAEAGRKTFNDLAETAKKCKAVFARIEPPFGWDAAYDFLKAWRIVPAPSRFTPEHTLIIDLQKSEPDILAQMKPKGRYNIAVARRRGVVVERYDRFDAAALKDFYRILEKTGRRDEFGIHPQHFYEEFLRTFCPQKMAALFLAKNSEGHTVAGIIVVFYKETATYCYGASDHAYRALMAPYLLQWNAILEAQKRGMSFSDLLGIAPKDADNHLWAGVTEFKRKFGGREVAFPQAFDIIYSPILYGIYRQIKKQYVDM